MVDHLPVHRVVFGETANVRDALTTIVIPLYNYGHTIVRALESAYKQDAQHLSILIVDDASSDNSLTIVSEWLEKHHRRFQSARLIRHEKNSGLSATRNTGFHLSDTLFIFTLDADNMLYPRCVSRCEKALHDPLTAFVYPMIEVSGASSGLMNTQVWNRDRLARGNYIDAMALIRKQCWQDVGGYTDMPHGWEDFDMWCSFSEQGWHGVQVPEILARYRVHSSSMLRTHTNRFGTLRSLSRSMKKRHKWLNLQH